MTTSAADIAANTTLEHLGGAYRLQVMVGLRNSFHKNDGRTLVLYAMSGRVVEITIEADDTYTVSAMRIRGSSVTRAAPVSGVYVDNLHAVLAAETGLAWRL